MSRSIFVKFAISLTWKLQTITRFAKKTNFLLIDQSFIFSLENQMVIKSVIFEDIIDGIICDHWDELIRKAHGTNLMIKCNMLCWFLISLHCLVIFNLERFQKSLLFITGNTSHSMIMSSRLSIFKEIVLIFSLSLRDQLSIFTFFTFKKIQTLVLSIIFNQLNISSQAIPMSWKETTFAKCNDIKS